MNNETPYIETELLLAVMNKDKDHARELMNGMYVSEINILLDQLNELSNMLRAKLRDILNDRSNE